MAAYVITYLEVTDPEAFAAYRRAAAPTFALYGGKPVVVDGHMEVLEGMLQPKSVVMVEFESLEQAKRWYASREYAQTIPLRQQAANASLILVDGLPPSSTAESAARGSRSVLEPTHRSGTAGGPMTAQDEPVQARITAFWSTVASGYEAHRGNVPARDSTEYGAWVEAIKELLPPAPADVLDIATGTGFVALIAAGLGHRVTGIDLSSAMLDEARAAASRRGLGVTFEVTDAVAPTLAAASFDAIISRHLIWTLREPLRALRNWLRLLRPGGRVVAIDGFWFDQTPVDEDAGGNPPGLFEQHYTKETRTALPTMQLTTVRPVAALFEQAGFEQVTVGELGSVHALADDPPSSRPWYVLVARRPSQRQAAPDG